MRFLFFLHFLLECTLYEYRQCRIIGKYLTLTEEYINVAILLEFLKIHNKNRGGQMISNQILQDTVTGIKVNYTRVKPV